LELLPVLVCVNGITQTTITRLLTKICVVECCQHTNSQNLCDHHLSLLETENICVHGITASDQGFLPRCSWCKRTLSTLWVVFEADGVGL